MQVKSVGISCETADSVKLDELVPLQGGLKYLNADNAKKLRSNILEHGITTPFFTTGPDIDGNLYLLDGHQRLAVLKEMRDEGISIPEQLPCVFVHARSIEDAKEKLLAITSQYGTMTQDGLLEFTDGFEIDLDGSFNFDAIDFSKMTFDEQEDEVEDTKHNDDKPAAPCEADLDKLEKETEITCPHCDGKFHI